MPTAHDLRRDTKPFLVCESLSEDELRYVSDHCLTMLGNQAWSTEGALFLVHRIALEAVQRERHRRGEQLTLG